MASNVTPDTKPAKKTDGPDATSGFYDDQLPVWKMLDTLLAGTNAMRKAEKLYLPKYANEAFDNYAHRLERTTLLNYFKRTVTGLVGKPFSKPVVVPESMDDQLTALFDDIDHQGNDINAFFRETFRIGLSKGMVHVLCDYPDVSGEDYGPQTLKDERDIGATPYMCAIEPENVLAAYCEYKNGVEVLTHIRIKECTVERDEWEEKTTHRIRILEPGTWAVWKKGDDEKYALESSGKTSLDYIPLVTWYAEREGFMRCRPPLLDLAHLNVAHWQSSSDQRNILSVSRFPILVAIGVDPETKLEIGPNNYFCIRDVQGKMMYVEHAGSAIASGREDLEDLKTEMAMMGLQLLMPGQGGTQTATAKSLDGAEADCGLQSMVLDFENMMNKAVDMMADWLGIEKKTKTTDKPVKPVEKVAPKEGEEPADKTDEVEVEEEESEDIKINADFGLSIAQATDMQILLAARAAKEISREAFIAALKRRNILTDDFDMEKDGELIDKEKSDAMEANKAQMVEGLPPAVGGPIQLGRRPPPKPGQPGDPAQPAAKPQPRPGFPVAKGA